MDKEILIPNIEKIDNINDRVEALTLLNEIHDVKKSLEKISEFKAIETYNEILIPKLLNDIFGDKRYWLLVLNNQENINLLNEILKGPVINNVKLFEILIDLIIKLNNKNYSKFEFKSNHQNIFSEMISNTILNNENFINVIVLLLSIEDIIYSQNLLREILNFHSKSTNFLEECPLILKESNYFANILNAIYYHLTNKNRSESSNISSCQYLLDKLILQGQLDLIVSRMINELKKRSTDDKFQGEPLYDFLKKHKIATFSYEKLIKQLLKVLSRDISINLDVSGKAELIYGLLNDYPTNELILFYNSKLLTEKHFTCATSLIILQILNKFQEQCNLITD